MTLQERINAFIKKYPEPYQFRITLQWKNSKGEHRKTYNPNALLAITGWRNNEIIVNTGHKIITQHYRYDEQLGLCELAYAHFDHRVPKEYDDRSWIYGERYFIPQGTKELYDIRGNNNRYYYERSSYNSYCYEPWKFAQQFTRTYGNEELFRKNFIPFIGNHNHINGSWCNDVVSRTYDIELWFKHKDRQPSGTKKQKEIDSLTAKLLPQINVAVPDDRYSHRAAYIDAENLVVRLFSDKNEVRRVYYNGGKWITAKLNESGRWVAGGAITSNLYSGRIQNVNEIYKFPHMEYMHQLFTTNDDNNYRNTPSVYEYIKTAVTPEIEQLTNMGCINLAKMFCGQNTETLHRILGHPVKGKGLLQRYQITKSQLQYINNSFSDKNRYYNATVPKIKKYLCIDRISDLDLENFCKYWDFLNKVDDYRMRNIISNKVIVDRLMSWSEEHNNAVQIYSDTCNTYNYLNADRKPAITPSSIKRYEELVRYHNIVMELYQMQQAEQRALWNMQEAERQKALEKKMAKLDETRKKLNYKDDKYTIRIPNKLIEITMEGQSLSHCVGGYVSSHAQGNTTILFLRKNDEPDKSFYTIELHNDNSIQQIHGKFNKWLGNDQDAIPTVMRWLKANNIYCKDEILLSTSKGYSSGNATLVAKPKI